MPHYIILYATVIHLVKVKDLGINNPKLYYIWAQRWELPDAIMHLTQANNSTTILRESDILIGNNHNDHIHYMLNYIYHWFVVL